MSQTQKTIAYLFLILFGYLVGQYPFVPSFKIFNFIHTQPGIEVFDKCISITLLAFSMGLLFALWHNFWLRVVMSFINGGMFNNVVDEFTDKQSIFSTNERISLLLALLTTSILIWKRHRKLATK